MTINWDAFKRRFLCRFGIHATPIGGVEILKYEPHFDLGRTLRYRAFAKCPRCNAELPDREPVARVESPRELIDLSPPSMIRHRHYGRMNAPCETCGKPYNAPEHSL